MNRLLPLLSTCILSLSACQQQLQPNKHEQAFLDRIEQGTHSICLRENGLTDTLFLEPLPHQRDADASGMQRSYAISHTASMDGASRAQLFTLHITKASQEAPLRLSTSAFTDTFNLNVSTPDTLLFQTPERPPPATCHTCISAIVWHTQQGLIRVERLDGRYWQRR